MVRVLVCNLGQHLNYFSSKVVIFPKGSGTTRTRRGVLFRSTGPSRNGNAVPWSRCSGASLRPLTVASSACGKVTGTSTLDFTRRVLGCALRGGTTCYSVVLSMQSWPSLPEMGISGGTHQTFGGRRIGPGVWQPILTCMTPYFPFRLIV